MADQRMSLIAHGAKARQNFDGNPPRCTTCVYFRREPHTKFVERNVRTRRGRIKTVMVPLRKDPKLNPIVDRCSFGDFLTKPHAVCDEWHSHQGEVLEHD
jgi:hypothetical protein